VLHLNGAGRRFAAWMGNRVDEPLDWREALDSVRTYDKDGHLVPREEMLVSLAFAGRAVPPRELTLVSPDGLRRCSVLAVAAPLPNPHGQEVTEVVTAFQDISQLRDLADAKDRFLSIASHELRSPITSLRATTALLEIDPSAITDEQRRAVLLSRIKRQVDRLNALVERLLDTARLNAREVPLDYGEADLTSVCREAIELMLAASADHVVELDEAGPVLGSFDASRVEQVLTNLIGNALRYSPAGSTVTVKLRKDGARAIIQVVDRGIGIPPEQVDRLFTPFYRGQNAIARHKGGLGLGLYIASEIVRRHGGSMSVESRLGLGSTFIVELPLHPK
jgi:signal transduction histidine kinase